MKPSRYPERTSSVKTIDILIDNKDETKIPPRSDLEIYRDLPPNAPWGMDNISTDRLNPGPRQDLVRYRCLPLLAKRCSDAALILGPILKAVGNLWCQVFDSLYR